MRPNLITRLKEEWNNLDPVDPLRGLIADAIDALVEAQPSKPWVGLTQEERDYIWHTVGNSDAHGDVDGWSGRNVMDAIEAKLREKNS